MKKKIALFALVITLVLSSFNTTWGMEKQEEKVIFASQKSKKYAVPKILQQLFKAKTPKEAQEFFKKNKLEVIRAFNQVKQDILAVTHTYAMLRVSLFKAVSNFIRKFDLSPKNKEFLEQGLDTAKKSVNEILKNTLMLSDKKSFFSYGVSPLMPHELIAAKMCTEIFNSYLTVDNILAFLDPHKYSLSSSDSYLDRFNINNYIKTTLTQLAHSSIRKIFPKFLSDEQIKYIEKAILCEIQEACEVVYKTDNAIKPYFEELMHDVMVLKQVVALKTIAKQTDSYEKIAIDYCQNEMFKLVAYKPDVTLDFILDDLLEGIQMELMHLPWYPILNKMQALFTDKLQALPNMSKVQKAAVFALSLDLAPKIKKSIYSLHNALQSLYDKPNKDGKNKSNLLGFTYKEIRKTSNYRDLLEMYVPEANDRVKDIAWFLRKLIKDLEYLESTDSKTEDIITTEKENNSPVNRQELISESGIAREIREVQKKFNPESWKDFFKSTTYEKVSLKTFYNELAKIHSDAQISSDGRLMFKSTQLDKLCTVFNDLKNKIKPKFTDLSKTETDIDSCEIQKCHLLFDAARRGHFDEVNYLLEQPTIKQALANKNVVDIDGCNPLHYVAFGAAFAEFGKLKTHLQEYIKIIELLLQHGFKQEEKIARSIFRGYTAYAIMKERSNFKLVQEYGAEEEYNKILKLLKVDVIKDVPKPENHIVAIVQEKQKPEEKSQPTIHENKQEMLKDLMYIVMHVPTLLDDVIKFQKDSGLDSTSYALITDLFKLNIGYVENCLNTGKLTGENKANFDYAATFYEKITPYVEQAKAVISQYIESQMENLDPDFTQKEYNITLAEQFCEEIDNLNQHLNTLLDSKKNILQQLKSEQTSRKTSSQEPSKTKIKQTHDVQIEIHKNSVKSEELKPQSLEEIMEINNKTQQIVECQTKLSDEAKNKNKELQANAQKMVFALQKQIVDKQKK